MDLASILEAHRKRAIERVAARSADLHPTTSTESSMLPPSPGPNNLPVEVWHSGKHLIRTDPELSRKRKGTLSFVWDHGGESRTTNDNGDNYWRCQYCRQVISVAKGTTSRIIRHLLRAHGISNSTVDGESESRSDSASTSDVRALFTTANQAYFRNALLEFIITNHLPFTIIESNGLRKIVDSLSPNIKVEIPSTRTVRRMIIDQFAEARLIMQELFTTTKSQIHLSFDIWTSPNGLAFLGVIAHWLSYDGLLKIATIAMHQLAGSHSGENIASELAKVTSLYQINNQIGVLVSDNATVNDSATTLFGQLVPTLPGFYRRGRCLAHIINLAAKSFIFGHDIEAFTSGLNPNEPLDSLTATAQAAWRKKGPIEKLHNLVVYIQASPQRRERFALTQEGDAEVDNLIVILDNSTRWNSTYLSINRAIRLRRRLQIYCCDDHDIPDTLTDDDWQYLHDIHRALEPFYEATKEIEGNNSSAWQVLPLLDHLLSHCEAGLKSLGITPDPGFRASASKRSSRRPDLSPLAISYQNAWQKLTEYYARNDDDYQIYAAATLYNPAHRRQYFTKCWGQQWDNATQLMVDKVWNNWKARYSTQEPPELILPPTKKLSLTKQWMKEGSLDYRNSDEFKSYVKAPLTHFDHDESAGALLTWWIQDRDYPLLKQHAIDLLTIPATSAEPERLFSQARRYITDDRNRISGDVVEAMLLLKNWWQQGHVEQ